MSTINLEKFLFIENEPLQKLKEIVHQAIEEQKLLLKKFSVLKYKLKWLQHKAAPTF